MPHNADDISLPLLLGVASADFDGYVNDHGLIEDAGTSGWCMSTVTGQAVFHGEHMAMRDKMRFVVPAYELAYYGAEVLA